MPTVSGRVRDSYTGEPVVNALVELDTIYHTWTTASPPGFFAIPGVEPGYYTLHVYKAGYFDPKLSIYVGETDVYVEVLVDRKPPILLILACIGLAGIGLYLWRK